MMDLTSLAAPMGAPLAPETFASAGPDAGVAGSGKSVASAAAGQTSPSAEGFLQVLEMFLGSSPLPSSLLGATAITQSGNADPTSLASLSEADQPLVQEIGAATATDLDEQTSERIANLLQMLGFQVKPSEIQELSPLDREQLGNALEFVQRNLERGSDPAQVAENVALLLPRPWALDDADGTPVGTGKATAATDGSHALPANLVADIAQLREKIQASLGKPSLAASENKTAGPTAAPGAVAAGAASREAKAGSDQNPSKPRENEFAGKAVSDSSGALLTDPTARAAAAETSETPLVPRHLPPGGTTSELIGRQVLEKVHLQLSDGHREIKLRLWPEELGEVRLALKMGDNDKVHANLVVENDAVRQAILDATPQLRDALARHGMDLERLSVSVSQKDAQQAADQGQGGREKGSRRSGARNGWAETEVAVAESVTLGEDTGLRNGRNTIDLWS